MKPLWTFGLAAVCVSVALADDPLAGDRAKQWQRDETLIESLVDEAQSAGAHVSLGVTTPYVNTIGVGRQPAMPGDRELEARLRHYVRWNALALVVRANKISSELGGRFRDAALRSGIERLLSEGLLLQEGAEFLTLALRQPGWRRAPTLTEIADARVWTAEG